MIILKINLVNLFWGPKCYQRLLITLMKVISRRKTHRIYELNISLCKNTITLMKITFTP